MYFAHRRPHRCETLSTGTHPPGSVIPFSDLAIAAYCPRKLYYERREGDREVPPEVRERRDLAFRYGELLAPGFDLSDEPIAVTPTQFRARLHAARERLDAWEALANPSGERVLLEGRESRGVAHKMLDDPLAPAVVSAGEPPDRGVWAPQAVRAVAAAKALAWEREREVERAFVEYPAHGRIREVSLTTRRKALYRQAVETVKALDGPPPRLDSDEKCAACEFRPECGTRTRSLRSLLE